MIFIETTEANLAWTVSQVTSEAQDYCDYTIRVVEAGR